VVLPLVPAAGRGVIGDVTNDEHYSAGVSTPVAYASSLTDSTAFRYSPRSR
jgi:hypothetical protein